MPKVNNNADDYANQRIGIFFPGFPNSLTGQCVSLNKWFLAEMTEVPNPQSARGNAKDYGDTLVNQGHARIVPASDRKRGDFLVWKQDGGGYGHIGVLLSGDRVFEGNVGIAGSIRGVFEGNVVYASRIDPLNANWRKGAPTYYRINTYKEKGDVEVAIIQNADNWRARVNRTAIAFWGRPFTEEEFQSVVGRDTLALIEILGDNPETDNEIHRARIGSVAINDAWEKQIYQLQDKVTELESKPPEILEKEVQVIKEVPVEVEKIVYQDKIVEVVKGDDERTFGDLLTSAFKKLFRIK